MSARAVISAGSLAAEAEVLVKGSSGAGEALLLSAPISFWGGVDPRSGDIIDARHPQRGENVAGRVLFLPGTIGSSSASAVLLELVHAGRAPAAIVMHEPDAILLLGLVVAREMGWETPVAVQMERGLHTRYAGRSVTIGAEGTVEASPSS
jgi:predicted aconitase with swiveling domain